MGQSRADLRSRHRAQPARPATVLIVDADRSLRDTLEMILRGGGYRILQCADGPAALDAIRRHRVDLVIVDALRGARPDGFEVLGHVRQRFPEIEVVMVSGDRDVEAAVRAIKLGAFDFLAKDYGALSTAAEVVGRALARRGATAEGQPVGFRGPGAPGADRALDVGMVVRKSARMRDLLDVAAKVAPTPARVLIQGESGTGKELLARLIHRWSDRAEGPFVAVNVAAIPHELAESMLFGHERGAFSGAVRAVPGRFEVAAGGTLLLDEVGLLPLGLQGKLLRVLQEREFERVGGVETLRADVRLVAATNVDLAAAVRAGTFREDLFYRLNVIPLRLPPLRDRREEIPDLVEFFGRRFAARVRREPPRIDERAMAQLIAYDWPGNVRELENVIERLVTLCDRPVVGEPDLPVEIRGGAAAAIADGERLRAACEAFERSYITSALERCSWNKAACARYLGISYATLKNKLAKYRGTHAASGRAPSPGAPRRGRRCPE